MSALTAVDPVLTDRPTDQATRHAAVRSVAAHGHRLLQGGILLFLLGLLNGFVVHGARLPGLALTAHLVALMGGMFLLSIGLVWPCLRFRRRVSLIGVLLAFYSFFGGWLIYLLAATWGAGGMFPLAAAQSRATAVQETFVAVSFTTVAVTLLALSFLLLWGLRGGAEEGA